MALPVVIAKNQTGSPIFLPRLGITVPASPDTITLTDFASFYEISWEAVLQTEVLAGNVIINDGVADLSAAAAAGYLDATGNLNGPVTGLANNVLLKLSGTSGRYTTATGISVDSSDNINLGTGNITTTGNINASGGGFTFPTALSPTPTVEGQAYWDTDDNVLRVGDGTSTVTLLNVGAAAGGDLSGTYPNPTVVDLTIAGEQQGSILYFNGSNWVQLAPGTSGNYLRTNGTGANPSWAPVSGGGATLQTAYDAGNSIVTAGGVPILFTLTNGGFTVNGSGTISLGGGATTQTVEIGVGAGLKTVTVGSTNTTSSLTAQTGTGAMTFTAGGVFDVNATGNLTLDSSGGSINIGADANTGAINVGTGAAARTITVGNSTGATQVNVTAGTGHTNVTTGFVLNGVISPTALTTDTNDYNPTGFATASTLRISSTTAVNLTGLAGGVSGRVVILTNVGTQRITLTDEDANSTAANRFALPVSVRLSAEDSIILQYDGTSSRWRAPATSKGTDASNIKSRFYQFGSNASTARGDHNTVSVRSNDSARFEAHIPDDFVALVSFQAIMIPGSTNATANIDLASDYAALGEAFNVNSETDTTSTYSLTINLMTGISLATVATNISAGDFFGVTITHNAIGGTANYLGTLLRYYS